MAASDTAASSRSPTSRSSLLGTGVTHGVATVVMHLGAGQGLRQTRRLAEVFGAFPEARTGDTGRAVAAGDLAVRILARDLVDDKVLQGHDLAFHAHHLGHVGDLARAVAQA